MDERLAAYRRAGWLGADCRYLLSTPSTNDEALSAGAAGAPEGLLIVAEVQTAGRGRLGRSWSAPAGSCLLLSLLFRPPEPFVYHALRTTMLCGLAMLRAVRAVTGVPARLKWPNDVIVERRTGAWSKLAGILSDVGSVGGVPSYLVIGIGLNVNVPADQVASLSPNATSLLAESGAIVDRVAMLDRFLSEAEQLYDALREGQDPYPQWRAEQAWLGRQVELRTPLGVHTGVVEDVAADGSLVLRTAHGTEPFSAGDVSLRLTV